MYTNKFLSDAVGEALRLALFKFVLLYFGLYFLFWSVNKFCREYHGPYTNDKEPGKRSRYCDSPRAERVGVRTPVSERVVLVSFPS